MRKLKCCCAVDTSKAFDFVTLRKHYHALDKIFQRGKADDHGTNHEAAASATNDSSCNEHECTSYFRHNEKFCGDVAQW